MPRKTSSAEYLLPLSLLAFVLSFGIPYMWVAFLALVALAALSAFAGLLGIR